MEMSRRSFLKFLAAVPASAVAGKLLASEVSPEVVETILEKEAYPITSVGYGDMVLRVNGVNIYCDLEVVPSYATVVPGMGFGSLTPFQFCTRRDLKIVSRNVSPAAYSVLRDMVLSGEASSAEGFFVESNKVVKAFELDGFAFTSFDMTFNSGPDLGEDLHATAVFSSVRTM